MPRQKKPKKVGPTDFSESREVAEIAATLIEKHHGHLAKAKIRYLEAKTAGSRHGKLLARKPLSEPNVAKNVLRWGTGAINVDGCRIIGPKGDGVWGSNNRTVQRERVFNRSPGDAEYVSEYHPHGRWPANVILDPDSAGALDEQAGERKAGGSPPRRFSDKTRNTFGEFKGGECPSGIGPSTGGPSRFFYCAKASPGERGEGNDHPTVKPVALMVYLCRLIVPPGGLVLDPFCGSGSTLLAAGKLGLSAIGLDIEWEYLLMAKRRAAQAVML